MICCVYPMKFQPMKWITLVALFFLIACIPDPLPSNSAVTVLVFPNPVEDQLGVNITFLDSTAAEIRLIGAESSRELLFEGSLIPVRDSGSVITPSFNTTFSFDISDVPAGNYRLLVETDDPELVQTVDVIKF